jgi:hypothetical protein
MIFQHFRLYYLNSTTHFITLSHHGFQKRDISCSLSQVWAVIFVSSSSLEICLFVLNESLGIFGENLSFDLTASRSYLSSVVVALNSMQAVDRLRNSLIRN